MEKSYLENFFCCPFQNGFLVFTIGGLFILTVYHFILFFQQKDKTYILYSGYTFFIILSQFNHFEGGFLYDLGGHFYWIMDYPMVYTEIYYILYVLFALQFLNIKEALPSWHKGIMIGLWVIISYCSLLFLYYFLLDPRINEVLLRGYYIFTILMSGLGIVTYIPFFKVNTSLRYYMIIGSLLLLTFSVASLAIHQDLTKNELPVEPSYSVLYVGFLLENILFSLGLGQKQKQILEERNQTQKLLIHQFQENEQLRIEVQKQLEESVKSMELAAKAEKMNLLQASYDKELAELKLLALRSQMNPHFIFNSLNSIKSYIIENEAEEAIYYLNKFAKLIRKFLASTREKESTLQEELDTMKLYVNIENLRFDQQIHFSISGLEKVDPQKILIPSLLLQPFLENAIWHGLSASKEDKKLQINLLTLSEEELALEIIDNGIGLPASNQNQKKKLHKSESVGISLSQERLKHFSQNYTREGEIKLVDLKKVDPSESGVQVIIKIPIKLRE
ncbi:histidine kinase [Algoriphagus sp.]|uniref:sensor histidine kinase n=1 Tax=Algoriphagus sp. TaxID=1872435 RepID=UPI0025D8EBDD|nr:histidine kinase [Algoriphagus sp.]